MCLSAWHTQTSINQSPRQAKARTYRHQWEWLLKFCQVTPLSSPNSSFWRTPCTDGVVYNYYASCTMSIFIIERGSTEDSILYSLSIPPQLYPHSSRTHAPSKHVWGMTAARCLSALAFVFFFLPLMAFFFTFFAVLLIYDFQTVLFCSWLFMASGRKLHRWMRPLYGNNEPPLLPPNPAHIKVAKSHL